MDINACISLQSSISDLWFALEARLNLKPTKAFFYTPTESLLKVPLRMLGFPGALGRS